MRDFLNQPRGHKTLPVSEVNLTADQLADRMNRFLQSGGHAEAHRADAAAKVAITDDDFTELNRQLN